MEAVVQAQEEVVQVQEAAQAQVQEVGQEAVAMDWTYRDRTPCAGNSTTMTSSAWTARPDPT